ncbi:MAG: flagellar motor switch phosphatase FliY [Lachnospiraceae bacterium]|nr:flagellar motor switch phosphatase FliY [Lachnospiraceae bacterium]MBP3507217.1 flagellar motor switch phosphatase FliY [Lachnospiraceae bacterium]
MDGMLSQEEINVLMSGLTEDVATPSPSTEELAPEKKDVLGEISNICMGTAATTLYSLVNQKVVISTPKVDCCTWDDLAKEYALPCVFINIAYVDGIQGNNLLVLMEKDVKIITDLMMGGDGTNLVDTLTDLHLSAICEAMNQMMGSAATSMSSMLNRKIDISPPEAERLELGIDKGSSLIDRFQGKSFVKVSLKMEIGDLVDSNIMQLYPIDFANELYEVFSSSISGATESVTPEPQPQVTQQPQAAPQPQPMTASPQMQPVMGQPQMQGGQVPFGYAPQMQNVNVQPVQFQSFTSNVNPITQQENIDLIMDVPLEVTVELGRTKKSIKEILEFAPGTIVELDKLAGEPIDVLVNGKMVAKGEVVVIEESFGIRITDIVRTKMI